MVTDLIVADPAIRLGAPTVRGFSRALLLAFVVAALTTSCSAQKPTLPSVEVGNSSGSATAGPGVDGASDFLATARAFFDCLSPAGVPIVLNDTGTPPSVEFDAGQHHLILYRIPGLGPATGGNPMENYRQAHEAEIEDFYASSDDSYFLSVDGIDLSAQYADCHASTGYDEEAVMVARQAGEDATASVPSAEVEGTLAANVRWATCAREHGWPQVKDPVVPADPALDPSWRWVTLPATIQEDQLRLLLRDCPNYDPEAAVRNEQLVPRATVWPPEGWTYQPSVQIDPVSTGASWSRADVARVNRLSQILSEAEEKYTKGKGKGGG